LKVLRPPSLFEYIRAFVYFGTASYLLIEGIALEYAVIFYGFGDFLMRHGEPFLLIGFALFIFAFEITMIRD